MKITKKYRMYVKYIAVAVAFLLTGGVYLISTATGNSEADFDTFSKGETESAASLETSSVKEEADEENESTLIYVYICGQVMESGVKACKEGTRLYELIEYAGGMTELADPTLLNLADVLQDGEKIYVPALGEDGSLIEGQQVAQTSMDNGKVNINSATVQELMTLPGIGQARAEDIVAYRQENGHFQSIEDIQKVSGIKEKAYEKMKEFITI